MSASRNSLPSRLGASLLFLLLNSSSGFALELTIKNDLPDKEEGSTLIIEEARSVESPKSRLRFDLIPGEEKRITNGNVTYFILTRAFADHKIKYEIECKPEAKGAATVNLLKIHNGDLPAGCKTTRTGHWSKRTGMNWDTL